MSTTIQEKIAETLKKRAEEKLKRDIDSQNLTTKVGFTETIKGRHLEELRKIAAAGYPTTRGLKFLIRDVLYEANISAYCDREVAMHFNEVEELSSRIHALENEVDREDQ